MADEESKGCDRCQNAPTNLYQKNLPRPLRLCDGCWRKFVWVRAENLELWNMDAAGFVDSFAAKSIPLYPNDENFRRRLALRSLYRLRSKRVKMRSSLVRSFDARAEDVALAAEILDEDFAAVKQKVLIADVSPGISAIEARLQKLLEMEPLYIRYLANIRADKCGPGTITLAGLVGEIGSMRTRLCYRHERNGLVRPRLFHNCEHGQSEDFGESLLGSAPNERAYGVAAFPTTADLRSFFGLGFRPSGASFASEGGPAEWYLRNRPMTGEDLSISLLRKTLAVEDLAGSIEKRNEPDNPWNQFYQEEKTRKAADWRQRFSEAPPPRCSACITSQCAKCQNCSGNWERPANPDQAAWVCRCHKNGYWFGSPMHVRNHSRGKTASLFLDLLFHVWNYLETGGEPPRHPLAQRYLQA